MFESIIESIKSKAQPYYNKIPAEEVFIGTIIFYVIFSLAFFMADHSNIDVFANTIMFYNSWIIFCSVVLYLITANVFCCVIIVASFLGSSLAELILGTLYYPSRMYFLTAYLHHILYSLTMVIVIYYELKLFSVSLISTYIELSAILQSIKNIWKVKNIWFDIINTAVFFITRIILWIAIVCVCYILHETPGEKYGIHVMTLFTFAHIFWSYTQIRNLIRRYFSSTKNICPIQSNIESNNV